MRCLDSAFFVDHSPLFSDVTWWLWRLQAAPRAVSRLGGSSCVAVWCGSREGRRLPQER